MFRDSNNKNGERVSFVVRNRLALFTSKMLNHPGASLSESVANFVHTDMQLFVQPDQTTMATRASASQTMS